MSDIDNDTKTTAAAELRMAGHIKMFEAAIVVGDDAVAEQQRQAAHEQLDVHLDAKASVYAGVMKKMGRKP